MSASNINKFNDLINFKNFDTFNNDLI